MEEVEARLDVEIFVDCPKCGYLIDLMNEDDTSGVYHNDEGQVMRQACPDGSWIDEHKKFSIKDVTCSRCDAQFNVKGIEW